MPKFVKRIAIALAVTLMCFAATYSWHKRVSADRQAPTDQKPIARLVTATHEVQAKPQERLIWQKIFENQDLYAGEAVRTSAKCEARIEFLDGKTKIDLEPNSAMVIESDEGKVSLNFVKGNMFVKSEQTAEGAPSAITLKAGDKNIELNGSELSLGKSSSGQVSLQVHKGTAQVKSAAGGGKTESVDASQTFGGIKILKPAMGDALYVDTKAREQVKFEWKPIGPDYNVTVEAGSARDTLKPVDGSLPAAGDKGAASGLVHPGRTYWRLVARSSDATKPVMESPVYRFQVLAKSPAILLEPENEAEMILKDAENVTHFRWANPGGLENLVLEWAKSADFKDAKQENVRSSSSAHVKISDEGKYYWRVTGALKGRTETVTSAAQSFSLAANPILAAPVLEKPLAGARENVETVREKGVLFSWKHIPGAVKYKFTLQPVKEDPATRKLASVGPAVEQESNIPQLRLRDLKPGAYAWSVFAVDSRGALSKPGELRDMAIMELAKLAWADGLAADEQKYITAKPIMKLSWVSTRQDVTGYRLRVWPLRGDPSVHDLGEPLTISSGLPKWAGEISKEGYYEAEVDGLDASSQVVARSARRTIHLLPAPLLPAPEFSKSVPPEINASGAGQAAFTWQSVSGAKGYVVNFYKGKEVKETKYAGNSAMFSGLKPGTYQVSLRSVDEFGRPGLEGDKRPLKVPATSDLRAPKLKNLNVK